MGKKFDQSQIYRRQKQLILKVPFMSLSESKSNTIITMKIHFI